MLKISIREKLFWISMIVMLFVGLTSGLYLEYRLKGWFLTRLEKGLMRHARVAQILLRHNTDTPTIEHFDKLADELGKAAHARITIIRREGKVLGDSSLSLTELQKLPSHHMRPEIKQAIKKGSGLSRRFSETLKQRMLYVAVPYHGGVNHGVVRVSMSTHQIAELTKKLRLFVLFSGVIGMIVAVFLSWMASYLFTRALQGVLENTQAIAETSSPKLSNEIGMQEAEGFASSLNRVTHKLEQTVTSLASERNRFEAVLENMNAAVLVIDERQRVQLVNRPAHSMMQFKETPDNKRLQDLIESEELLELFEQVQTGESASIEFKLKGPPDHRLLARATPLPGFSGTVMVLHDLTELRQLERIRRDFVANVSHELRTPVSIIRANAETLLDGALEEPEIAQEFLLALLRQAERLSSLISDLLEISRIEANEHQLDIQDVFVSSIINRSHEAVEAIAHNRQQTSSVSLPEGLVVRADVRAFEQIMLNLLENAIKYTPKRGNIAVDAFADGEMVRIEVRDSGLGIAPKYRTRIFERFYRIDKGRSRDMGGTGLGLAIVKHLTDAMGGEVGIEPAMPHGSIFWFSLPSSIPSAQK